MPPFNYVVYLSPAAGNVVITSLPTKTRIPRCNSRLRAPVPGVWEFAKALFFTLNECPGRSEAMASSRTSTYRYLHSGYAMPDLVTGPVMVYSARISGPKLAPTGVVLLVRTRKPAYEL